MKCYVRRDLTKVCVSNANICLWARGQPQCRQSSAIVKLLKSMQRRIHRSRNPFALNVPL